MTAYSFKPQFIPPILAGTKAQTIRADRKRHARQGEEMQLYTGMRTRACRLIGRATCLRVTPIRIDLEREVVEAGIATWVSGQLDEFARADGFASWPEMRQFWRDNHHVGAVFSGVMVQWGDFRAAGGGDA